MGFVPAVAVSWRILFIGEVGGGRGEGRTSLAGRHGGRCWEICGFEVRGGGVSLRGGCWRGAVGRPSSRGIGLGMMYGLA